MLLGRIHDVTLKTFYVNTITVSSLFYNDVVFLDLSIFKVITLDPEVSQKILTPFWKAKTKSFVAQIVMADFCSIKSAGNRPENGHIIWLT